jgi:acyl-CoA thioesterase
MTSDTGVHARAGRLELDSSLTADGPSAFDAVISPDWGMKSTPNGGYLMSLVLRAMGRVFPLHDPLTATAHYNEQTEIGPARIEVETIRVGRTLARGMARLIQGDRERMRVLAAFGTLPAASGHPLYSVPRSFDLAPLDECTAVVVGTPDGGRASVREHFDVRYDPSSIGWVSGAPTGKPQIRAWVRASDGSEPDRHLLPVVVDALPSTAFDLGVDTWVPTVELTIHQRARPAPGWLQCAWDSTLVADGMLEEDGQIWDSAGNLVAMSRQLALLPRSAGSSS